MARTITFVTPNDTCLFTPLQLQPTAVFRYAMSAWASWLREYVTSFPRLVRDHHFGAVVAGVHADYVRPFGFFDSDAMRVEGGVRIVKRGELFLVRLRVFAVGGAADGACVVDASIPVRPLRVEPEKALGAIPCAVPDDIARYFQGDELDLDATVARPVADWMARSGRGAALAESSAPIFCSRSLGEVADQWSFVEVPAYASLARERMVVEHGARVPRLRDGLRLPIKSISVEYRKPAFVFDELEVRTRVVDDGELVFAHEVHAAQGREPRALIVERF